MFETEQRSCSNCGAAFESFVIMRAMTMCTACIDRERAVILDAWRAEQRARLAALVVERIETAGMSSGEATLATLDRVPLTIKRLLPRDDVVKLLTGESLDESFKSFGLQGGQGIGKTFALAALIRRRVETAIISALARLSDVPDEHVGPRVWYAVAPFRWACWPEVAAWAKTTSTRDRGALVIEDAVARWTTTPLLVLDDVGRERASRGGYDEDLAIALLDRVIDARARYLRPLLWTTNLTPRALAARYGASLTSRLLGLAPLVECPNAPDARLARE